MGEEARKPRRVGRPRKPLPPEGTHHLVGDRRRYWELAGQLEVLAFTEAEDLFLQREAWLWEQLLALGTRRGLVELTEQTEPTSESHR